MTKSQELPLSSLPAVKELRDRMPTLHPYIALTLTLDSMLQQGDIDRETYLKWVVLLASSQGQPMFGQN